MGVRNDARFLASLVATSWKGSLALRGAFWVQAAFMVLNDVVFFVVWVLFFDRFESIGGWRLADLAVLYGVVATAFGVTVVLFGGVTTLARTIAEGELDAYLTQPKPVLLHVLGARSMASGWGDVVAGIGFLALSGQVGVGTLPVVAVAVLASATVFLATGVLVHAVAFWAGPMHALARQVVEFVITFSLYPGAIHGSLVRALLFTILPAGFVGLLPADLVRDFTVRGLLLAVGGALGYGALALWAFRRGLRRYESGSRFATHA